MHNRLVKTAFFNAQLDGVSQSRTCETKMYTGVTKNPIKVKLRLNNCSRVIIYVTFFDMIAIVIIKEPFSERKLSEKYKLILYPRKNDEKP